MLSSLSASTRKHYRVTIKKWISFCESKNINPYRAYPYEIIEFLTIRFREGCSSYSTLNSDRSAIALISSNNAGVDKLVCRFIKGCFRIRPSQAKYSSTWNVEKMFNYIENVMKNSEELGLSLLSYKTAILLALTTAQRSQYLSKIKVEDIEIFEDKIIIQINEMLKTSRPGVKNPVVILHKFDQRPKLCVFSTLKVYLKQTESIREKEPYLFISYKKPHKVVGTQTLARWIKAIMKKAGINTEMFTAHSTRHASTSAAFARGLSINLIKENVGWSKKSEVFARHYNRPINKDNNEFASIVLSKQ